MHGLVALTVAAAGVRSSFAQAAFPFRLPNSPYPAPSGGANASCGPIVGYGGSVLTGSQRVTLQTLQGGMARSCPSLFRIGNDTGMANQWLSDLQAGWGVDVDLSRQDDFGALLKAFTNNIAGYVTYSAANAQSVNVAVSYCAALTTAPSGGAAKTASATSTDRGGVVVAVELGDVAAVRAALPRIPLLLAAENLGCVLLLLSRPCVRACVCGWAYVCGWVRASPARRVTVSRTRFLGRVIGKHLPQAQVFRQTMMPMPIHKLLKLKRC